jgi:DNA-binding response OmpR family regulator
MLTHPSVAGKVEQRMAETMGSRDDEEARDEAARDKRFKQESHTQRAHRAGFAGSLLSDLTPLVGQVRTEAHALGSAGRRGEIADHASRIEELAAQAEASLAALARLMAFESHERALDLTMVDLGDVLMSLLAQWKTRAPSHAFELALPGEIPLVSADAQAAEIALNALIEDAVALTAAHGEVHVSIRPELDSVEIALRPQTLRWGYTSTLLDYLDKLGKASDGLEPEVAHARIHFALARAAVERHGGQVWIERDVAGDVALRASWRYVAEREHAAAEAAVGVAHTLGAMPPSPVAQGSRQSVLVWEPESRMARYLRSNLDARLFRPIMSPSLADIPRLIETEEPDLLVLAVVDEDRTRDIVERASRLTQAPVILLAAEYDAEVCAHLLDAGAADYLAKPLHIEELFARIRAALRTGHARESAPHSEGSFHSGELSIDFTQRRVTLGEREIALSKTEFKLLRTLAQNAGKVLSHDWLLERVWGASYRHETEFIWVYIRRLRRKIEPDPKHPRYVLTVPGVGYRLARP